MLNYNTKLYQLGALPVIRPGTTHRLAVGSSSTASTSVDGTILRLVASVDCHIQLGANPTADTNSLYLCAGLPEYFACAAGDKVAVIRASADGVLFITAAV